MVSATGSAVIERREAVAQSGRGLPSIERDGPRQALLRYLVEKQESQATRDGTVEPARAEMVDPLGYAEVIARLESEGGGEEGFHPAWQWFDATVHHAYPDALYRLVRAFDLVESPASIICSVAPGYMYGSRRTELSGRLSVGALRYTHGALDSGDTLGFLVSDHPAWQGVKAVPFDRAFDRFVAMETKAVESREIARAEDKDKASPHRRGRGHKKASKNSLPGHRADRRSAVE